MLYATEFTPKELGDATEIAVERHCIAFGFQVLHPKTQNAKFDRLINGKRVQIKSRKKRRFAGQTGFHIELDPGGPSHPYSLNEVEAFVLYWDVRWFIFPADFISGEDGRIKNSLDVRRVFGFENAWHVLDGEHVRFDRQLPLFA